jgi:hypothetical protein
LIDWVLRKGGAVNGIGVANLAGSDGGSGWGLVATQVRGGFAAAGAGGVHLCLREGQEVVGWLAAGPDRCQQPVPPRFSQQKLGAAKNTQQLTATTEERCMKLPSQP